MTSTPQAAGGSSLVVSAMGVSLRLVVDDAELAGVLHGRLQDITSPDAGVPDGRITVAGCGPWHIASVGHSETATTAGAALAAALTAVNLSFVASTKMLAAHAAVVSRAGVVVALAAASQTGKSTLTATLVKRCGWTYHSDEALILPWVDGVPHAYPRPLSLSPWSVEQVGAAGVFDGGETHVTGASLGASSSDVPGKVALLVLVERDDAADGPRIESVSGSEGVAALTKRSFTHFLNPGAMLTTYASLCSHAEVIRLTVGAPSATADALHQYASTRKPR